MNKFKDFDFNMSLLLKEYILNNEDLFLVRFLLTRFVKLVNKKINDNNKMKNKEEKTPNYITIKNDEEKKENIIKRQKFNNDYSNNKIYNKNLVIYNENAKKNEFDIFLEDNYNNNLIKNRGFNKNESNIKEKYEKRKNPNYFVKFENQFEHKINNIDIWKNNPSKSYNNRLNKSAKINNISNNGKNNNKKLKKSVLERRKYYPEIRKNLLNLNEDELEIL